MSRHQRQNSPRVRRSRFPSVLEILFEAVAAFGTVGLSMGITAKFGVVTKLLLIGLMYIGRLGPLILMDFFAHLPPAPPVRYATEELMVG